MKKKTKKAIKDFRISILEPIAKEKLKGGFIITDMIDGL